ncbi:MAG: dephospho-CoA kinase [Methylococcales bacterium]
MKKNPAQNCQINYALVLIRLFELKIESLFGTRYNIIHMLKIGLTGGIGCGKTTVANLFSTREIPVIEADVIARQLVNPGQPALDQIVKQFGPGLLTEEGQLNRSKLRTIVFESDGKRKQLETILHPLIIKAMDKEQQQLIAPYCVFCIPLLLETGLEGFVDHILVIDCPVETQIQRVAERDKLSRQEIQRIIQSQVSRDQRLKSADDIITNNDKIDLLEKQVEQLHLKYILLSEG